MTAELKALAESQGFDVREIDPATGMASLIVRPGSELELRAASDFPSEVIEAVRSVLAGRTDVRRAFALQGTINSGRHSNTLGLELAPDADA